MEKKIRYDEALAELENIVSHMENDELDIDNIATQLKRAQELIKLCKTRLADADAEIKNILSNNENV